MNPKDVTEGILSYKKKNYYFAKMWFDNKKKQL